MGCAAEQAVVPTKEVEIEEVPEIIEVEEVVVETVQTVDEGLVEIPVNMVAGENQLIVLKGVEYQVGVSNIFLDTALISVDGVIIEVDIGSKELVNGLQVSVTDILLSNKESVSDRVEFTVKAVD